MENSEKKYYVIGHKEGKVRILIQYTGNRPEDLYYFYDTYVEDGYSCEIAEVLDFGVQ